jgi:alkylation response protein AidB-like acyl-CoA dehydrogenase
MTERDELQHAVRRAVEKAPDDAALWTVLCEQIGVAALGIPEEHGGAGGGLPELAAVGYELGRGLAGTPLLGAVLAAQLLLRLGETQHLRHLAAGTARAAVCWAGDDGGWSPERAAVTATAGTLTGATAYVLDGATADVLLVVAADDGDIAVHEAGDEGVTRERTATLDDTRSLARVTFAGAPARRIKGDASRALRHCRDAALIVQAAENAGAARQCLDMTVAYSKQRVQFGRPIGSFQALKHRMADLHVLVETAGSAAFAAADGTIDADTAAAYCADALLAVAAETIQLHGGIAITWEHDAHRYFKRAHAATQLFGSPAEHRAALAGGIGL